MIKVPFGEIDSVQDWVVQNLLLHHRGYKGQRYEKLELACKPIWKGKTVELIYPSPTSMQEKTVESLLRHFPVSILYTY
jgi:hypothetical protein